MNIHFCVYLCDTVSYKFKVKCGPGFTCVAAPIPDCPTGVLRPEGAAAHDLTPDDFLHSTKNPPTRPCPDHVSE